MDSYKAAALTFDPAWGDLEGNIRRMVSALDNLGQEGVRLAVLPEQATIGYAFDDFHAVRPHLDTVPGKTTAALEAVTRKHSMWVAVGIAEFDPVTGLGHNTAALIGPDGYLGRYRKHGLNPQDQRWVSLGNEGFPVFDTDLGRLTMLICYDNTYWQYARLAALHDVDVLLWLSASDRDMPSLPASERMGDHSTVAAVQYMAAQNGVFVVAATRNGVEVNAATGQKLYYNGGSSIWNPQGDKLAQAPVFPPKDIQPGLHGYITATLHPAEAAPVRASLLARRRPELYGELALHRAPTDRRATQAPRTVTVTAVAWESLPDPLPNAPEGGLLVLPELFLQNAAAEDRGGPSEQALVQMAGQGWVVGSYRERDDDQVFHTVALASSAGVLARYRATHPLADWASPGHSFVVVDTPIGRLGLVLAEELQVPEVLGMLCSRRADIVAAPQGQWVGPLVQLSPELFETRYPPATPLVPFAAAALGQFWVVTSGWETGLRQCAVIYGPEPVIATPPQIPQPGEGSVTRSVSAPWVGTWINQRHLVAGQNPWATIPLVLPTDGEAFEAWRRSPGWRATWAESPGQGIQAGSRSN